MGGQEITRGGKNKNRGGKNKKRGALPPRWRRACGQIIHKPKRYVHFLPTH